MEEQVPKLEQYFKRMNITTDEDDGDDFNNEGKYWEPIEPEVLECWSLHLIPMTHLYCFSRQYKH